MSNLCPTSFHKCDILIKWQIDLLLISQLKHLCFPFFAVSLSEPRFVVWKNVGWRFRACCIIFRWWIGTEHIILFRTISEETFLFVLFCWFHHFLYRLLSHLFQDTFEGTILWFCSSSVAWRGWSRYGLHGCIVDSLNKLLATNLFNTCTINLGYFRI